MKKMFLFSLILFPFFNYAQTITVTGKVQDEAGNSLSGATIIVKGRWTGTCTDMFGNFSIPYIHNNDSLICSYVGHINKVEKIEGNTTIIFILEKEKQNKYSITIPVNKKIMNLKESNLNKDEEERRIFTKVEMHAVFPGGEYGFNKVFQKNFSWPDDAKINFDNSVIKIGLTINKDGSLKKITMIKGINASINKAVTDALIKMPPWIPTNQNGRNTEDYCEISLKFAATE